MTPASVRREPFTLFLISFGLLLVAAGGIVMALRSFLGSLTPLWVSVICSGLAVVTAVASVLVPRRR